MPRIAAVELVQRQHVRVELLHHRRDLGSHIGAALVERADVVRHQTQRLALRRELAVSQRFPEAQKGGRPCGQYHHGDQAYLFPHSGRDLRKVSIIAVF